MFDISLHFYVHINHCFRKFSPTFVNISKDNNVLIVRSVNDLTYLPRVQCFPLFLKSWQLFRQQFSLWFQLWFSQQFQRQFCQWFRWWFCQWFGQQFPNLLPMVLVSTTSPSPPLWQTTTASLSTPHLQMPSLQRWLPRQERIFVVRRI